MNKLTLSARTELIVQVPVDTGPRVQEGIVERAELMPGVYMAESLVTVAKGCVITSIINTTEEDVEFSVDKKNQLDVTFCILYFLF